MITKTFSACIDGFEGHLVVLEASRQNTLPQIQITGLPSAVVQESRERVRASLNHLGFDTPKKKILIHLSPAETKKSGSHFDFPIAMNVLTVDGFFPAEKIKNCAFLGELTLSGELRPISQFIPLVEALLKNAVIDKILVPFDNRLESALFSSQRIFHCRTLKEAIGFCFFDTPLENPPLLTKENQTKHKSWCFSFDRVIGHDYPKRVFSIALAGSHPLLLEGPPGSGKTLLTHSAVSLLPPLEEDELIEVSRIYSFFGEQRDGNRIPPFRSPHHSISSSAFLGGGRSQIIPGELSLAHRGLLFLDELPEFRRDAIEGLREPLESGEIHLHRISRSVTLPADFSLVAAMNPCPCGYLSSSLKSCSCSPESIRNYRKKISGPILDRFPLYLWMESVKGNYQKGEPIHRALQNKIRDVRLKIRELPSDDFNWSTILKRLDQSATSWLSKREHECRVSFRRMENAVRVGLTISLLDNRELISVADLEEAWALRSPESLI